MGLARRGLEPARAGHAAPVLHRLFRRGEGGAECPCETSRTPDHVHPSLGDAPRRPGSAREGRRWEPVAAILARLRRRVAAARIRTGARRLPGSARRTRPAALGAVLPRDRQRRGRGGAHRGGLSLDRVPRRPAVGSGSRGGRAPRRRRGIPRTACRPHVRIAVRGVRRAGTGVPDDAVGRRARLRGPQGPGHLRAHGGARLRLAAAGARTGAPAPARSGHAANWRSCGSRAWATSCIRTSCSTA